MPFALVTIGLLMIVSGSRDTYAAFGKELVSDFTGPGNFGYWIVALAAIGAVGYVPQLRNFSRLFMALVIVAMVIRNGGVFDKLTEALAMGPVHPGDNAKNVTPQFPAFDASDYASDAAGNFERAADVAKQIIPALL